MDAISASQARAEVFRPARRSLPDLGADWRESRHPSFGESILLLRTARGADGDRAAGESYTIARHLFTKDGRAPSADA